jgi:hypothetical protein
VVRTQHCGRSHQVSLVYHDPERRILIISPLTRSLTNAFPACGLGVSAATDGIIFRSDVFAASNTDDGEWGPVIQGLPWSAKPHPAQAGFGSKAVLVLVNVRLGTNTVNPIYYDSLKVTSRPNVKRRES